MATVPVRLTKNGAVPECVCAAPGDTIKFVGGGSPAHRWAVDLPGDSPFDDRHYEGAGDESRKVRVTGAEGVYKYNLGWNRAEDGPEPWKVLDPILAIKSGGHPLTIPEEIEVLADEARVLAEKLDLLAERAREAPESYTEG